MSKKNRRNFSATPRPAGTASVAALAGTDLESEYRIIKHDLIRVVIVNIIFLGGVLALYYTNMNSHYLERWFSGLVKF